LSSAEAPISRLKDWKTTPPARAGPDAAPTHGSGGFDGTVNRRTDALTIKTTGRLSY
jgi:hypothetical protein